jgi:DNA replication and repair protein RecF
LIDYGSKIDNMRHSYIEQLTPVLNSILQDSFNLPSIRLKYQSGWDQKVSFSEALRNSWESDVQRGVTHCGPHKADLKILSGHQALKDFVSRGQQKIITTLLVLSQIDLYGHSSATSSTTMQLPLVLLIDDLPAELDQDFAAYFLKKIIQTQSQLFVTATDYCLLNLHDQSNAKLFHVEHGRVQEQ